MHAGIAEAAERPGAADVIRSPYDGAVVGRMPVADAAAVEAAIERAQRGYEIMRRLPRFARADILERTAEIIRRQQQDLVTLIAQSLLEWKKAHA